MAEGTARSRRFGGGLRLAFQMAVDDDVLRKNLFGFEIATVVVMGRRNGEGTVSGNMKNGLWNTVHFARASSEAD